MKNTLLLMIVCMVTFGTPARGQWTNPTTPAEKRDQSTFQNCKAYLYFPAGEFTKIIVLEYYGKCTNGLAEGYQTINAREQGTNDTVVMTSNFFDGYANNNTQFSSSNGLSFSGNLHKDGSYIGKLNGPDGLFFDGEIRDSKPYTAAVRQAKSLGGYTLYFLKGVSVNQSEYLTSQSFEISQNMVAGDGPRAEAAITEDLEDYPIQQPTHNPTMSTFNLNGSKKCQADLPSKIYKIEADFPGRCSDGLYTGKADLTLTPRDISTALKMKMTLKYQAGQITGPVKATYIDLDETYVGNMVNWVPSYGESTKDIGNRNFQITNWQDGQAITQRVEYKPPSEAELALKRMVIGIATAAVDCYVVGTCKDQRQYERRAYRAEQARSDDLAAQAANQRLQQENAAIAEEIRRATNSDPVAPPTPPMQQVLLDGTLISPPAPVRVANNDAPVFGGTSEPPAEAARPILTTNEQVFGGQSEQQAQPPVILTRPPEIPAPQPAAPSIPEPIIGVEPPAPPVPAPVRVADLPDPITPQSNGVPQPPIAPATRLPDPNAPPVQPAPQSDTLGTGPAPSNPVPQTAPPVVQVANNPSPAPAPTPAVNQMTRPTVPYGLAPSGSSSTPAIATNPIILRWSSVTGTDYYDFGISSEATGYRLVVDQRLRDTFYSGNLSPGKYRFNLRACNSRDECSAFANPEYFQVPNASNDQQSNTQPSLTVPRIIAPTNPGELAPTVPLQWSEVNGATYYQLAVRDLSTNELIVNQDVRGSIFERAPYPSGRTFRWNVAACNQNGCGERSGNGTFITVASATSPSATCDATLTPDQESIVRDYVEVTKLSRPQDSTICRWKQSGTLVANIVSLSNETDRVRKENRGFWEISFSERHRVAVASVRNSAQVDRAIDALAKRGAIAATGPFGGDKLITVVDLKNSLLETLALYNEDKQNPSFINKASIVKLISNGIVDEYAMKLQKKLGFPIKIPPSLLYDLAAVTAAEYGTSFIQGR